MVSGLIFPAFNHCNDPLLHSTWHTQSCGRSCFFGQLCGTENAVIVMEDARARAKAMRCWTRKRKYAFTVCCVIGFRGRPCSALVTARPFAPFTTDNCSCSPTALGLLP
jgi:hypothetical protein